MKALAYEFVLDWFCSNSPRALFGSLHGMKALRRSMPAVWCLTLGCSGGATPSARTVPGAEPGAKPPIATEGQANETVSNVSVAPAIRDACGLSEPEAHFAYDSARVSPGDDRIFEKLAQCFIKGNLFGRTMALVGRADPRGDEEYNLLLGGRRADAVQNAIVGKGLDAQRIRTSSRGEYDAKGADEATWAKDRRVDILLAD